MFIESRTFFEDLASSKVFFLGGLFVLMKKCGLKISLQKYENT